jgi:hypothetical protein
MPALLLLNALGLGAAADQGFEDGQDVAAELDHTAEDVAELRFTFCFAMPFGKDFRGDSNITAKVFGAVTAEEEPVEKCSFALRVFEIAGTAFRRVNVLFHG